MKKFLSNATIDKRLVRTVYNAGVFAFGFCIIADAAASFEYASVDFPKDTPMNLGSGLTGFPEGLVTSAQGVPFNITPVGINSNAIWCPGGCGGTFENNGTYSITAPVGLSGLHTIYTLMNSGWGDYGSSRTTVFFNFEGIANPLFAKLEDGNHLRDTNYLGGPINGINTVQAFVVPVGLDYNEDVIDMQAFAVPISLQDSVLTSITFVDERVGGLHVAMLRGITVSSLDHVTPGAITLVPEPETYAMLLAGLGVLGFMARCRKQSV